MTLADGEKFGGKEQRWEDEDVDLTASGNVGEDLVVELKLSPDECQKDLQFVLLRGDVPMPSDRYQIQTRGNVVQLTLKQSQKEDTGHYALVAKKLSTGLSIAGDERVDSRRKIRLSIKDPSQVIDEGEPPIFVRRLSDLAVKVGTRTRFLVEIRSSTSPKVTWHKNDEPVQSGSRFSFVHEGNFYCVDVAPVMVDDQGNWTCMAENSGGRSSCTSFLNVIVPKAYKKPEFVEELRALLTETGTVSLECKVVGVPTPVLKWFKDQKEIKAGDVFALTANPDDPTSLGTYTCEAVNCMGTACSSSRVHVVGKGSREGSLKPADALTPSGPLPVFKKILRDESCKIGDTLTLSCQVLVPPWPKTITWYNKEGRVEPSEKYHIIEDGLGGYSIEIKGVEAMDEGEWKCVATSAENMKQFSTCFVAMSLPKNYRMPRFMESLKAVLTEEGLVSFECKVVGFPTPLLRWFKDGQELHPGDVYQLTGTNSLGSYCCIARNCMGEAKSTAELTVEDIQNQLNEEERMQLLSTNQAPKFVKGLRSCEARINEDFTFTIQVSVSPEPSLSWYRDDVPIIESEKYRLAREVLGTCHLEVKKLEFMDQAEWKCVAANDFGHSVTSCFLKLVIPKHFKKPKFLESLRAILSEEGAVNLECKVIGVPQPVLKWYKDGVELKPGDIHRIISGQDGTCCLGTYTCEATNCMGSVSSSASLLGFEDRVSVRKEEAKETPALHELARNLSLSTIHEERTSQLYDTPQTDHSITLDDRGEVSFSFDGKEVSVSLYETPDLTEEEALQIVEMYADQLSEHITEGNVIELPPMRFTKETSTTGNLLMEAVVIDVSPDYFIPDEGDDLRTEADVEDVSIMDDQMQSLRSLSCVSSPTAEIPSDRFPPGSPPSRPPRRKESRESASSRSERSDKSQPKGYDWSESYHSAKEPSVQAQSSIQGQDDSGEAFTDALSSSGAGKSKAEESRELYASFVEQTVERVPLDEKNIKEEIATQISEALIEEIPVKRKKKKKTGKGSRTPSLSSKASSEESYSLEADEKSKRRGKEKKDRRGSASSNKSTGKIMGSRSSSESVKFESAASMDRRRRESDATLMIDDIQIEQTEENLEIELQNKVERMFERGETEPIEERPASAISTTSTVDAEKSMSKKNKERLLENVYKLSEPIMALRSALVDLDSLLSPSQGVFNDGGNSRVEITERIVAPVENLCEQVSEIETKALKSAGDRSLAQNVRISLLEAIGGPTEELLRGVELLRSQTIQQQQDPQSSLVILESLTDPVDEILIGLTKIEHELTANETVESSLMRLEKPIAMERMCRAVERLGTNVGQITERSIVFGDESASSSVIERLQSAYQSLEAFLSTVPLNDSSGTLENNVDTLVVETLVRPLEELSRSLNVFSTANVETQTEQDTIVSSLEKSLSEMSTRLEALTAALEIYEKESGEQGITELHADLVTFLRYTMDDAVERLEKSKLKKKRVTQESRTAEKPSVTPMIFDGKSRLDGDESAVESAVESSEIEESNVLQNLSDEAASIIKKVTVPSTSETKKIDSTDEKSSTDVEAEPSASTKPPKKKVLKKQNRSPPELDGDLPLPEMLLDPLIDVQANLSDVISDFESQESTEESSLPGGSELAACLSELRECVATAAHTATTLKSANTVNALIDLREPLLDLQLAMASAASPEEIKLIQEATVPLAELKVIVAAAMQSPQTSEASQIQMKPVLRMLEDIEAEVTKVSDREEKTASIIEVPIIPEIIETRSVPQRPPEEVERAAVALTGVHFALSSALERVNVLAVETAESLSLPVNLQIPTSSNYTAEQSATSNLISSIEDLRQCVGTLAVAIATPVVSTEANNRYSYDILFDELAKLEEPLLNLQKVLLTEQHGPEDRHVLNDVASPIRSLKEVVQDVTREVGGGSTPIVLELIEDVEKDVSLIAMEALKKALARKSEGSDDDGRASVSSSSKPGEVPAIIAKWLDPIEDWLTSAEETAENEESRKKSAIAPVVDDLKRELLKIAIQTSYSEPPSDVALIEALTELQEPLAKVCRAIAECHEPENLDIVEGLVQPTKHLLGTIFDASLTHEAGKVLRPVLEAIEELENQIPLTIKRATYERELQRVVRSMTPEEMIPLVVEEIPGTSAQNATLETSKSLNIAAASMEVSLEENAMNISQEDSESLRARAEMFDTDKFAEERAEVSAISVKQEESREGKITAENAQSLIQDDFTKHHAETEAIDVEKSMKEKAVDSKVQEKQEKSEIQETAKLESTEQNPDIPIRSETVEVITVDGRQFPSESQKSIPSTSAIDSTRADQLDLWTLTLLDPLDRLGNAVLTLDRSVDEEAHGLLCRPLDSLHKQIEIAESQFNRPAGQSLENDVETIIEGFLSPVNQLHSALRNAIEVWQRGEKPRSVVCDLLRVIAESSTELCEHLDSLRNKLIVQRSDQSLQEQQEDASLVETINAVIAPLEDVRNLIEETLKNKTFLDSVKMEESDDSTADRRHHKVEGEREQHAIKEETIQERKDAVVELQEKTEIAKTSSVKTTAVGSEETFVTEEVVETLDDVANIAKFESAEEVVEKNREEGIARTEVAKISRRGSKGKEESLDIEESTARPLEELIEAIVDSSAPRRASSSPEGYQSVTPDVLEDLEKSDTLLKQIVDDGKMETTAESKESAQGIQAERQKRELKQAETAQDDIDEGSLSELSTNNLQENKAMLLTQEDFAKAETKKQKSLKAPKDSQEEVLSEDLHEIQTESLNEGKAEFLDADSLAIAGVSGIPEIMIKPKDSALSEDESLHEISTIALETEKGELRDGESLAEVKITDAPEMRIKAKDLEISESSQESLKEISTEILEKAKGELREDSILAQAKITEAPETRIKASEAELLEASDAESLREIATQASEGKVEILETESLATAKINEAPEMRIKARDAEISEASIEESLQEISAQELEKQKVELREAEGLSKIKITDAPETRVKPMEVEESKTSVEESLDEISIEELEKQTAELREDEGFVKVKITDSPQTRIKARDAEISEASDHESLQEISTEELETLKVELLEVENLIKANVTEPPETRIIARESEISEASVAESLQEISIDEMEKQKGEIRDGENFSKAKITDAPEIRIKATDAVTSEISDQESLQEISTDKLEEQKARVRENEGLSEIKVTAAPESFKIGDAQILETSEAAEIVHEIPKEESLTKLQEAITSVEDSRHTAQIAIIKAAEIAKLEIEEIVAADESAIVSIVETPTEKIFKKQKEGTSGGKAEDLVENIVLKPVEEVVAMEDQQIVEIVESPTQRVIKVKVAVERNDGVIDEVIEEITIQKPVAGWAKSLVEEEQQAASIAIANVQEVPAGSKPEEKEESLKREETEKLRKEEEEILKREEDERVQREEEQRLKREEDERLQREEEERSNREKAERLRKEEEERLKREEAERLEREETERLKREEAERLQREDEERLKREETERLQREEEERLKREEAERLQREEEERLKREEAERLQREEEERLKREEAERLQREEEERLKREEAERLEREETERLKREEAERLEREKAERLKREESERLQKEEEERLKREEAERLQREETERLKREEAERLQKEEEERLKREEAERLQREEEERLKREEAERLQREEEERLKREEAERLQREEEERLKREEAERLQREEEERLKREEAERLQREEEERLKREEAERLQREEEERLKREEAERLQREEEERLKREEAERLQREEEERLKREEAERLQREEEERLKREEAERLQREEEERLKREEAERLQREEEERLKREEAERLQREEEERLKREEAERLQREEEERLKREEAERLQREEEERLKREEAERLQREEEERLKREEAERLQREEEERLEREEAERLQKEKEERLKREEAERLQTEEEERLKREEAERLQREEEERLKREEAERLQREEQERLKREEAERLEVEKREEAERLHREEQERLRKEEEEAAEKLRKEEAEKIKREQDERQKQAEQEAERLKKEKEENERLEKEELDRKEQEAARLKKEKEDKLKKEEADRLQKEALEKQKQEAERLKQEELERAKKETEEQLKKEETERLEKEKIELQKQEEIERIKKKENERLKKEEAEKLKQEESVKKDAEATTESDKKDDGKAKGEDEQPKKKERRRSSKKDLEQAEKVTKDAEAKTESGKKDEGKVKEEDEPPKKKERRRSSKKDLEQVEKVTKDAKATTESANKDEGKVKEEDEQPKKKERRRSSKKDLERPKNGEERQKADEEQQAKEEKAQRTSITKLEKEKAQRLKIEQLERQQMEVAEKLKEEEQEHRRREEVERIEKAEQQLSQGAELAKKEVKLKQKEETKKSKRKDSKEETRLSSKKSEKAEKSFDDAELSQIGETSSPKREEKDSEKTPVNSEEEIRDKIIQRRVRVQDEIETAREPRSSSTIRTDSEMESEHSETYKSQISARRRSSGQRESIEDKYDISKERSERADRRGTDRSAIVRPRDATLSSMEEKHYTSHYSATSRYQDFAPGPRDRGKKPSFCTKLTDRTAAEASRIKLTCTVLGDPEPRVYWTKDGRELPHSSNRHCTTEENGMLSLELYAASPKDSGEYSCVAINVHGQAYTEAKLKVYAGYEPAPAVPTFTRSIKDTYHSIENELVLECRVRGQPSPKITWLKDGQVLQIGDRYQQCDLGDGICRLKISNPDFYDGGLYTCRAENDSKMSDRTSHVVNFEGKGREQSAGWRGSYRNLTSSDRDTGRPRFSSYLTDHSVPAGGTIALQVEVKGVPPPDITWMRGDKREPIPAYRARTFADSGVYTLIVPEATESETGTYVCRASNAYGYVDTAANVEVVSSGSTEGGKPAMFISRPAETMIHVTVGEDVSVSFRANGVPKPRIVWMKGLRDITNGPRSYKESHDDYCRLTLKRAQVSDEGTYCILAKNRYGCDRSFYTVKVKQRARSLTPLQDWGTLDTDNLLADIHDTERSYLKQVPGPITTEPVVVDGGRNWLALTWGKAVQHGPAPVVAYRVDAWLLGGEGGARWVELGITPVNAFDAFNLRPGGEYKFRITPRNRYGWGDSVTMTNSVTVREVVKFPDFSKILPGQLKALRGETLHLECEVRSESKADVKWYRDTTDIDGIKDPRYMTYYNGSKSTLTVQAIKEHDSGRYVCEATNPAGRVSTFARVQVVTDPKIVEADEKLRRMRTLDAHNEESPPEFTMRLRDRRVQMTYPVRLTCQVSGHPEPEITWYKNREEIFQDENVSFWDDESHFHTLEISHSTLEDSGIYMAKARNVNGSVSCRCHLVVDKGIRAYVAPEFFRHLDAVYTVKSGGELRMTAQIEAYPTVGIVWHRDGHRLRPSRSAVMTLNHDGSVELSLAYVTPRDAGLYCCTATNEVGRTESTTRVTVLGAADDEPPSITQSLPDVVESLDVPYSKEPLFVTKPLSTEAVEGDTVIILCEVVGDPKPEVIWLRDFLRPDYYRDAAHFRRVGAGPQYRLEIPYAKLDFTGAYSVIAKNCHGEAKAIISLQIYARGQGKADSSMEQTTIKHGNVQTLPSIKRPLRDLRCCDGDAVTLICKVHATPEPDVRWEKSGKLVPLGEDFAADFDGETARLSIQHVYPEDEGEYTCVAYNDLGKAFTSACLIVDVPEGKESALSRRLIRPVGLLSAESTPISTPRSTPVRSLSPSCVASRRELKPAMRTPRGQTIGRRPRMPVGPKFYAVPHNRVAEEGETVRFQCAVAGHPVPWVTWDKDGIPVTPTARISLKEKDDVRILEITEITHEDAGLYRITLENDVGRTEATARLEIIKGRHSSLTRTIRTRSASPRTYSIYSRSPITSAIRGDTHLRPNINDSMGGRGGTLSPTLPRWHHRNDKPPIESPEPVRRMNKRQIIPTKSPQKNGVIPTTKPNNPNSSKPRSSSVPRQNQNPREIPVNHTRQTKTSAGPPRRTNQENIRSNKNTTTTNGSMIPKRLQMKTSRSPKLVNEITENHRESINVETLRESTDVVDSGQTSASKFNEETAKTGEKDESLEPEILRRLDDESIKTKELSPPSMRHENAVESSRFIVKHNKEPRPPVIHAAPADVIALRGAKVILLATFEGEPQPRVRWLRKGRDVRNDDRAEIETSRGLTCLTLEGVTTEQTGKYAVTLENEAGRDCRYVNVTVEGVPDPPAGTPCVQSITRAGKAIVTWRSPPYDGGCAVTGYSVEMKRGEEPCWIAVAEARHSLSHTVTGLVPEETYRFRIRAENAHGVSEPSTVSDVVTVPGENDEEIGGQVFVAEINQIEIEEEEEEFEPAFEARIVSPEEGRLFEERYEVLEELGKGKYGIVRRILEKSSGMNLAAKFVRTIKAKDRQQVHEEIGIMNMLRHPKLLRLAAAFESPKEMIMVTEYISGGELFERVVADDFTLTEKDSIQFVKQICEGVEYMHAHRVVHLDLKPENIMCHTRTSHRIKLIDFGLAQTLKPDTPVRVLFGTPEFIPPEIIGFEPIGTESDMWSVGVICYVLLTGLSPFMGDNDAETFANITRADYDFDDKAFTAISHEAKDFISALLIKRKELRMSAKQCLEHDWLAQRAESMSRVALPTDKLKKFIVRRKWQKTGNAIRALGRMAILSANSRRSLSAGSSPTKQEFSEDLFNFTPNVHGFKPIRPVVVVEDRTGSEYQIKNPEDNIASSKVEEEGIMNKDREGKISNTNEEEHKNEKKVNVNEIREEIVIEDVNEDVEDKENEEGEEVMVIASEEFEEEDISNANEDFEEEIVIEKEEERPEIETLDVETITINSINCPEGFRIDEIVAEVEIPQNLEDEIVELSPVIEEIEDSILPKNEDGNSIAEPEYVIEEVSNLSLSESDISMECDTKISSSSSCIDETTRKQSFSSFASLKITEVGTIEIRNGTEADESSTVINENDEKNEDENRTEEDVLSFDGKISESVKISQDGTNEEREGTARTPFVTKAWCKTNNPNLVDEEDEVSRLAGRGRSRHIVRTGSVSRTAKMFEKEEESNSSPARQQNPLNRTTPMVPEGRPQNERIRKAFAFWNK